MPSLRASLFATVNSNPDQKPTGTGNRTRKHNLEYDCQIFYRLPFRHMKRPTVKIRGYLGSIDGNSVTSRMETCGTNGISIGKLTSLRIQALLDRVQFER